MDLPLGLFARPPLHQLAAFVGLSAVVWAASLLLLAWLNRRHRSGRALLPVAPFFVSVTTIFALFVGFLAADIWNEKRRASDSAYAERSAIERFETLVGPHGLADAAALSAVERYRRAVIDVEWRDWENRRRDPRADAALDAMWARTVELARQGAPAPVASHLLAVLDDVAAARAERLAIGSDGGAANAWWTMLALCLFSYAAIAAVHLDRPAAGRLALTVFALATTAAFWFLALHDSPYSGGVRLGVEVLEATPLPPGDP